MIKSSFTYGISKVSFNGNSVFSSSKSGCKTDLIVLTYTENIHYIQKKHTQKTYTTYRKTQKTYTAYRKTYTENIHCMQKNTENIH